MNIKVGLENQEILRRILCFPYTCGDEILKSRIDELKILNVAELLLEGKVSIYGNIRIIGKGHRGVIIKCILEDGSHALLKIRRLDADLLTIVKEALFLKMANSVGIGPKLLNYTSNMLVRKFVEGDGLRIFVRVKSPDQLLTLSIKCILQAYKLDRIGLFHGELSRPEKHIIIDKIGHPWIIDFGSASVSQSRSNVTQLISYFFVKGSEYSKKIYDYYGYPDQEWFRVLLNKCKKYKCCKESIFSIIEHILSIRHGGAAGI